MGILDNIGIGKRRAGASASAAPEPAGKVSRARTKNEPGARDGRGSSGAGASKAVTRGGAKRAPAAGSMPSKGLTGKGRRKRRGAESSVRERVASAAAPLHDRRKRLVGARETTLRDLGGLMLEMYKRNRFREDLLLDKCEEVLAIEVEIAHVDQRLFQLAPPNAAGMRPIGRCECGAPIHPGQNFCGVCGRSFATLTQGRSCTRCGAGLRPGDQFCATCGHEAPDVLQALEAPGAGAGSGGAAAIATSAVAQTVVIESAPPPLEEPPAVAAAAPTPAAATAAADDALPPTPPMDDLPATVTPPLPVDELPAATGAAPAMPAPAAEPVQPTPAAETTGTLAPKQAPSGFSWSAPDAAPDAAIDAAIDTIPAPPTLEMAAPVQPVMEPMTAPEPASTPSSAPAPDAAAGEDDAGMAARQQKQQDRERVKAAKARAKQAKARAKAKAKAARAARKRGGSAE